MNILITGGTGFIGNALVSSLLQQKSINLRLAVRKIIKCMTSFEIAHVGNINYETNWQEALTNIDTVIHLAARAHILDDKAPNPEQEFHKVNVEGTANLVKQSIAAGVKHFIFISSIGAMATLSQQTLNENSPCNPQTYYGKSKLQAEQALIDLASNSDMTWTIIRPTLVYGPGNPGNMERLIKLIKLGLPLPFGLVKNNRSFVYVGNLVDAVITCLTHPNAKNQTFIVSDGKNLSTPELISKIADNLKLPCQLLPVPSNFLRLSGKLADTLENIRKKPLPISTSTIDRLLGSLVVDNSHICTTLNWQPPYTIDVGLAETLRSVEK